MLQKIFAKTVRAALISNIQVFPDLLAGFKTVRVLFHTVSHFLFSIRYVARLSTTSEEHGHDDAQSQH